MDLSSRGAGAVGRIEAKGRVPHTLGGSKEARVGRRPKAADWKAAGELFLFPVSSMQYRFPASQTAESNKVSPARGE